MLYTALVLTELFHCIDEMMKRGLLGGDLCLYQSEESWDAHLSLWAVSGEVACHDVEQSCACTTGDASTCWDRCALPRHVWSSLLQSAPSQPFRIWFCAWCINEFMLVERAMFVVCPPTSSPMCLQTAIIEQNHSAYSQHPGRRCGRVTALLREDLWNWSPFHWFETVTSSIAAVKLNIILLTKSRISTFLLREFLLWHAAWWGY